MSSLVLDAEALYADLLCGMQLQLQLAAYDKQPRLVGVASGGAWLAQRLQKDLGLAEQVGILSSSMHRDDFSQRGLSSTGQTLLPFDVNGAHLIVVDDVLYTGRTLRAVLNELFDYGRPASVKLMVLVDRGGRELPVHADLAVARVTLPASQTLALARAEDGRFSFRLQELRELQELQIPS
jgi:pyrimidine operon attenuation protein / uracil phosphoribosyltransferase